MKKFHKFLYQFFWGRDENGNALTEEVRHELNEALVECLAGLMIVMVVAWLGMIVWGRLNADWWERWRFFALIPVGIFFFPFIHPKVRRIAFRPKRLKEEDLPLYMNKRIKQNLVIAVFFVLFIVLFMPSKESESFMGMLFRGLFSGAVFFGISYWQDSRQVRRAIDFYRKDEDTLK